ncbi:ABC transporter substrate-binding protein [Arhodomonas sp. AD133]|uniref:ABC transporter substrate-binding protein n=1 Tax=Arhodomonas sp. AD133 TaxID=3415009 RepID=UPI003EBEFD5C
MDVNRLRALAAGICLLLPLSATGTVSDDVVRVGVITDLHGIYSDWGGPGIVTAAEMAVEDVGGAVGGNPVEIVVRDDDLDPERAVAAAEKLHRDEPLDMIIGPVGSEVAIALQQWAAERDIVTLTSGAASTALTGDACTRTGIHWSYDTRALAAGNIAPRVTAGADRWYFVTADNAFGHILERQVSAAVEHHGGEVLGNVLAPHESRNFAPEIQEAMASGANVVAFANAGEDAQRAIRQAYELGMAQNGQQMVGLLLFLTDIRSLGIYLTEGLRFTTAFYWNRNAASREWSRRFFDRTGTMPTMAQAGTYSAVRHYLDAVAALADDAGTAVVERMKATPVNDFFARDGHIRADGRMVHDMYRVEVKAPDEAEGAWDYLRVVRTIPGEEAFGAPGSGCAE